MLGHSRCCFGDAACCEPVANLGASIGRFQWDTHGRTIGFSFCLHADCVLSYIVSAISCSFRVRVFDLLILLWTILGCSIWRWLQCRLPSVLWMSLSSLLSSGLLLHVCLRVLSDVRLVGVCCCSFGDVIFGVRL